MRSAPFLGPLFDLTEKYGLWGVADIGDIEIDEASNGKSGGVVSLSRTEIFLKLVPRV